MRTLLAVLEPWGSSTKVRSDAPKVIFPFTGSQVLAIKFTVSADDAVCTGKGSDAESVREYDDTMEETYEGMDAL